MAESNATNHNTNVEDKEFAITRIFDAPRELVFKVWSEVDHLKK
jgi:uncharacterized protein YndB with AHSA1/START domain